MYIILIMSHRPSLTEERFQHSNLKDLVLKKRLFSEIKWGNGFKGRKGFDGIPNYVPPLPPDALLHVEV